MSQKIGFLSVFALVIGSQIGSGVFMLPANLAPYGVFSIWGWLLSGGGAILLALVFAHLCALYPRTGGPHVYVQQAFGDTASFFIGWTYWVISWISTTVVILASIGYLVPIIQHLLSFFSCSMSPESSSILYLILELLLLVGILILNCRGVKVAAGIFELLMFMLKSIPLLIIPLLALSSFDVNNLQLSDSFANVSVSHLLSSVMLLTLWGFIGVESATAPADSVSNPGRTIPRALIAGTLFVVAIYILNTVSVMGVISGPELAQSSAPYVLVTKKILGGQWHLVISAIAAFVCISTLNAWTLASGQIALGLAQDNLLPSLFKRTNSCNAPVNSLLISAGGVAVLLILTFDNNFAQQISIIIDFSVIAFLYVYLTCALSYLYLIFKHAKISYWCYGVGIGAILFCTWVIFHTPIRTLLIAASFGLSGIPLYIFHFRRRRR